MANPGGVAGNGTGAGGGLLTTGGSGTGTAGAGATGGGGATDYPILIPEGCDSAIFEFESVIPTVMLLVDRSSSMFDVPYGPYVNRWQPLKDALTGDGVANLGVVGNLQSVVRFGFAAYTSQQIYGAAACPHVIGADVPIALNNYFPLRTAYDQASYDPIIDGGGNLAYKGETPTGAAVGVAANVLGSFPEPGPKYILLVTDGQPDNCAVPDPQCGQDETIAVVQQARAMGIQTFVIGIEMTEFDASRHLTQVANAGIGLDVERGVVFPNCDAHLAQLPCGGACATYAPAMGWATPYLPQNPGQLASDIAGVIGSMRSCIYDLTHVSIDTGMASQGSVQLQDTVLQYGDPNGWEMISATELQLNGTACEIIRVTPHPFMYVSFPCDAILY